MDSIGFSESGATVVFTFASVDVARVWTGALNDVTDAELDAALATLGTEVR